MTRRRLPADRVEQVGPLAMSCFLKVTLKKGPRAVWVNNFCHFICQATGFPVFEHPRFHM